MIGVGLTVVPPIVLQPSALQEAHPFTLIVRNLER